MNNYHEFLGYKLCNATTVDGERISIQQEKDSSWTAFLGNKKICWTGARSEYEAVEGLKTLYPNQCNIQNSK